MAPDARKGSAAVLIPQSSLERTHSAAERQSSFIEASSLSGDFDSMDRAAWEAAGLDADGSFDDYDLDNDGNWSRSNWSSSCYCSYSHKTSKNSLAASLARHLLLCLALWSV